MTEHQEGHPNPPHSGFCEIDIIQADNQSNQADCALVTFKSDWLHQQPDLIEDYHYLTELIASEKRTDVELNLEAVTNISSYSLGWFFSFATRLRDKGQRLVIKNPAPGIFQTIKLVQLDDLAIIENPPPPEALALEPVFFGDDDTKA